VDKFMAISSTVLRAVTTPQLRAIHAVNAKPAL